jgi:3-oxoacyl-[acyl-carrier protein] reductase
MQARIDATGEIVLVTGAATGLGFAIATAFGEAGATVALNDLDPDRVDRAAAKLADRGIHVLGVAADVRDGAAVRLMIERVRGEAGVPTIVVANAGIYPNTPFLDLGEDEWDQVMATNLKGVFLTCQAAARAMVGAGTGGHIVVVSSTGALRALRGWSHYCTSKAGVVMLARAMALELGEHGIRVNAVLPGYIGVDEGGRHLAPGYRETAEAAAALGRPGRPEDVADAVLLLASSLAGFVSGAAVAVDGGASAGPRFLRAVD